MQLRLTDNPINDVRIVNPWQELKTFCLSINLSELEEIKHKHVPWVVLLMQALEKYKSDNDGKFPNTSQEKQEFKNTLKSFKIFDEELNFDEALNYYYYACKSKCNVITPEIEEIFNIIEDASLVDLIRTNNVIMSNFFIVCKALQVFYNTYGTLPVVGTISDMTSDTETYITLKRMYEAKGKEDREIMSKLVFEIISKLDDKEIGIKKEQIISTISHEDVNYLEIISKNYQQMSMFKYSTIKEENCDFIENFQSLDVYEPHNLTNFIWYLLIKSADLFYEKNGRYPGANIPHECFENDIAPFNDVIREYLSIGEKTNYLPCQLPDNFNDYVYEFCRFGNSVVVPANSIISSVASQEIIKLITYQFKTINNTFIFDGINSTTSIFKF